MGNTLNCLEQCRAQQESNQQLLVLQKGAVFKRKKYLLGISAGTEQIFLRLGADEQTLLWRVHESQKELTRIHLDDVHLIKTHGALGFSLVTQRGDTLLDVEAETDDVRNNWVTNLQLLCEDSGGVDSEENAENARTFRTMIEERTQKQAYWAKRTQELEDRKRDAEERKKQFAGAGLKYTAIALTNRS